MKRENDTQVESSFEMVIRMVSDWIIQRRKNAKEY
jgi:hypothetical protein